MLKSKFINQINCCSYVKQDIVKIILTPESYELMRHQQQTIASWSIHRPSLVASTQYMCTRLANPR